MAYGNSSLLSDRGRAWLGSVEGVPPQQVPARAEMAAKTGLMPFQDALMIKQMADQIRASGGNEPPPPSNVMEQKLAMISGRAPVQQLPPPPQMQGPSGPPQGDPRLQSGLGTLSAPNMKFANGGIVAFAGDEGSLVGGENKYPPEFLRVIEPLLAREGGSKTTKIKGDRGGLTKFGISKASHPNVDVKNLTREDALAIYFDEYWKGSGADKVYLANPVAAEVLMDTAVHSGPDTAVDMYRRAGGDPSKLIDIRAEKLKKQVEQPSQKKFAEGFENRIQSMRDIVAEGDKKITNPTGTERGPIDRSNARPAPAPSGIPYTEGSGTFSGTINRGTPAPRAPTPAPTPAPMAGLPAALPKTGDWAGVGTVPLGALPNTKPRFLADVLRPGAAPATPAEIAHFNQAFGPNWRTKYAGMTHTVGHEATADTTPRNAPVARTSSGAPATPPARGTSEEMAEKALLDEINVEEEMKKRGMTDEERYLAHARAGFAGAAQRGKFADKFATFGSTLAEGLGSLKAADRKTRAELEDRAGRRQEAIAALGLKQRELDIAESSGLQKAISDYIKGTAALEGVRLKVMESLKFDPKFKEQSEIAEDPTHPENAQAKAWVAKRINAEVAALANAQEYAGAALAYPGMSAKSYAE